MAAPSIYASNFSPIDEYGFKRPEDFDYRTYDNFMTEYLPVLVRRGAKWDKLLAKGPKNLKNGAKLKRFVRKGIPMKHRAKVWMIISGANEMKEKEPDLYTNMLTKRVNPRSVVIEQISTDIPRTFPRNIFFTHDEPKGMQQQLFNVLLAYANFDTRVGYCQGMNYVAGLLLLVTKDEESAFWLLRSLTEKILPDYYAPNIPGLITDVRVLSELIKSKSPQIHKHVEGFSMPWELALSKWFMCLYSDVLPIETVLRIWDCLFYEGSKILIRVALTLVIQRQNQILMTDEFSKLVIEFKNCATDCVTVDCHAFMSNVFEISSPLPSRNLDKLRQEIWISVKEELDIQDERRKELKRSKEEKNNASSKASSEEDDTSDVTKDFIDLKDEAKKENMI